MPRRLVGSVVHCSLPSCALPRPGHQRRFLNRRLLNRAKSTWIPPPNAQPTTFIRDYELLQLISVHDGLTREYSAKPVRVPTILKVVTSRIWLLPLPSSSIARVPSGVKRQVGCAARCLAVEAMADRLSRTARECRPGSLRAFRRDGSRATGLSVCVSSAQSR